jgi:hypothetical protein
LFFRGEFKICDDKNIDSIYVTSNWLFLIDDSKNIIKTIKFDGSKMQTFIKY